MQRLTEWFLGIPPSGPGQGMTPRFSHDFPWPAWGLVLFVLFALAFVFIVTLLDAAKTRSPLGAIALMGLRCFTIFVLLVVLSGFQLSIERTGLPYLVVIVDQSGSMDREDQYPDKKDQAAVDALLAGAKHKQPTRLNVGKALLTRNKGELLKGWLHNHKLRIYTVAEGESRLGSADLLHGGDVDKLLPEIENLQPQGDQTRLGDAVRRVLNEMRGTSPTAIVLVTDGVTTDGESLSAAAKYARQKLVPLYILGLGNAEAVRDLELHDVLVDEVAFVDDPVTFVYRLAAQGVTERKARVSLKVQGKPEPLVTKEVDLPTDSKPQKLELIYTPTEVGDFEFTLEVEPLDKETDITNNRETRKVSVRREKIRVLLVDNLPRWECRELKMMLEREKTVDLKVVLQDADQGFVNEDKFALATFPVKREELFEFDVVLLGDVNPELLGRKSLDNLAEFVSKKGGGLVMMAGPLYNPSAYQGTPLETLLPVELTGLRVPNPQVPLVASFRPELTVEARKGFPIFRLADNEVESRQAWESLPGMHWYVETAVKKRGATVLAVHPTAVGSEGKLPLITFHRPGTGKVLFHAVNETWRWRFRVGDQYFGRYWVQVIRYLSRSKLLGKDRTAELTTDRREYKSGDEVGLRLRFMDERQVPAEGDVTVVIRRQSDGSEQKVKLSKVPEAAAAFEGSLAAVAEGSYHVWVATPPFQESPPAYDFTVKSPARERRNPRADFSEINRAAINSRGKPPREGRVEGAYTPATMHELAGDIPPGFPVPLDTDDPIRLWNHWIWTVLFAGCLTVEWLLRKRLRLV